MKWAQWTKRMKWTQTLRVRFALWTAGLLLIALVLFGLFVYTSMSRNLIATVDEALRPVVIQLNTEVELHDGELIVIEHSIEDPEFAQLREQGLSTRIFNLSNQVVYTYGPYQALPPPLSNLTASDPDPSGIFTTVTDPGTQERLRVFSAPIIQETGLVGVMQVAQNLNNIQRTLNLLLVTLLIGGPLAVIMAGGFGYFLAARALAPINEIIQTARQISAVDLSARLNLPATGDEVGRLAATLDSMLARLDEAFQRERQFTADASHELRTPLTAMQMIISSTIARPRTSAEYEQALLDLDQEVEQMRHLAESLLHLARTDAMGQPTKFEEVDLSLLLEDVIDSLRPLAEEKGLALIDETSAQPLTLPGDSDGLVRLFVNLVDNAIKYTEEGSITITSEAQNGQGLLVTIRDTGMGIAPVHLPHIFDRFYRVDSARSTDGAGLGLAIAQEIAHAHDGAITVESEVGQGTMIKVQLSQK